MSPCPYGGFNLRSAREGSEKSDLSRAGNWRMAGETVGVFAADQALWQKVSQETRGKILTSGDPKPVDKAVQTSWMQRRSLTICFRFEIMAEQILLSKIQSLLRNLQRILTASLVAEIVMSRLPRSISQMDVSQRMTPTRTFAIAKPAQ